MSGLVETIALVALIALGGWLLGPFVLRFGGGLLILYGLLQLLTGGAWVLMVVLGFLAVGAGEELSDFKRRLGSPRGMRRSPTRDLPRRVGERGEPCPGNSKVKFEDEHEADQEIARNQDRHDRGLADYRLERAYLCEHCGWWHVTSQAERE